MLSSMPAAFCAALLVGLSAAPVLADGAGPKKTLGELIAACMRDMEKTRTGGHGLTPQQRMIAEAQCRAKAEAEMAKG
ncbi:MAG TPA: hypothetical protein VKZ87_04990 [Ferrovibrio sp.]|jgi:hypothetical protein|uniref:hypothetical protein n=1 Tax=Ferrovibrio sp. TaxID=1917215 RepID=UPI002B4B2520|nr:hypothetical protein [Ferrovibrio sp.]HLT76723.1 hypothetical protein [Ferrovibrio sp.]